MIEYTNRDDSNNTVWACFTSGEFTIEVNITGITDEAVIQHKLENALLQAENSDWGES